MGTAMLLCSLNTGRRGCSWAGTPNVLPSKKGREQELRKMRLFIHKFVHQDFFLLQTFPEAGKCP
jgi:hypothetical protein